MLITNHNKGAGNPKFKYLNPKQIQNTNAQIKLGRRLTQLNADIKN